MLSWANSRTAAPKSALGQAFHYLKEQWPYLTNYLKDGRLEISNNHAERSIKPFAIDRKNFLLANTPKGARGSAVIFSLIQTAMENGLDPYKYLVWLLNQAKSADLASEESISCLLPWNASMRCLDTSNTEWTCKSRSISFTLNTKYAIFSDPTYPPCSLTKASSKIRAETLKYIHGGSIMKKRISQYL